MSLFRGSLYTRCQIYRYLPSLKADDASCRSKRCEAGHGITPLVTAMQLFRPESASSPNSFSQTVIIAGFHLGLRDHEVIGLIHFSLPPPD
jgi:hypothetical protein